MPTIGEVYNPLIQFALNDDPKGHEELIKLGDVLYERHRERGISVEDAQRQVKANLDYYSQYFTAETVKKVKDFYDLGQGFTDLSGRKWTDIQGEQP